MPLRPLRGCWHTDRRPARPAVASCRKPSPGSSLRSPCSWSRSSASRSAWRSTTQDPPQGALDTDLEGVTVVPPPTTTTEPEPEPPPGARRRPPLLADVRRRSAPLARPPRRDPRPSCAAVHLDAGPRHVHRVPARVLRGRAVRQRVLGHDVRARRGDGPDPLDAAGRRHAALEPGDRRAARPRRVAERNRHGTRPRNGADALAGADGGQGRVVPGRRRRHGVLRLARRPALRGALGNRPDPLGVPDRAAGSTPARPCSAAASA